jgi:phosphoglycolate phosphatase
MASGKRATRSVDLLIFDLDCTLADTKFDIAQATNFALQRLGLPTLPAETIYGYIGNGVEKIIERALTLNYQDLRQQGLAFFTEHYNRHLLDHTHLYPHVKETLEYFRHKKKAVATNKTLNFTKKMLEALEIRSYFDMILGGDSTKRIKPNPDPLKKILNRLQISPDHGVMVGDSVNDVLAGKQAGMITCALTYGLGKREDLAQARPDFLLDDIGALTEIFA